jgi:hypothetical protein
METKDDPGIKLQHLVPRETEVTLAKFKEPLKVRSCTLADDVWSLNKYGRGIDEVLRKPKVEEIVAIFFRLMDLESQKLFVKQKITVIDDHGNEEHIELGGVNLLMACMQGGGELVLISKAILESVGFSRPVLDKAEEETLKKKSMTESRSELDGKTSSTSSQASTVGPQTTSSPELSGKLPGEFKASSGVETTGSGKKPQSMASSSKTKHQGSSHQNP